MMCGIRIAVELARNLTEGRSRDIAEAARVLQLHYGNILAVLNSFRVKARDLRAS